MHGVSYCNPALQHIAIATTELSGNPALQHIAIATTCNTLQLQLLNWSALNYVCNAKLAQLPIIFECFSFICTLSRLPGYTATPTCTPARAAILTGQKPWNHGSLGAVASCCFLFCQCDLFIFCTHTHTRTHTRAHARTRTHARTHTRARTHTHTHAHTRATTKRRPPSVVQDLCNRHVVTPPLSFLEETQKRTETNSQLFR